MRVFVWCFLVVCGLVYSQLLVAQQMDPNANQGSQQEESWAAKFSGYVNYLRTTTEKKRVALVIGNGNYNDNEYDKQQQPPRCIGGWCRLKAPVNDANDMTVALTKLEFSVILVQDADLYRMNEAIGEFINQLDENTEALFYFSGHGMQNSRSQSLLVPIDAQRIDINVSLTETAFEKATVILSDISTKMKNKKSPTNIIILDACRENSGPERNVPTSVPLTPNIQPVRIDPKKIDTRVGDSPAENLSDGFLIAYATAPGVLSAGGNEVRDRSLYTQSLLKHIFHPGPYHVIFEKARQEVMEELKRRPPPQNEEEEKLRYQMPWESNSLRQTFYFVPRKLNVHGGFQ